MRARLVVFPIKGRNWCFTRSLDPPLPDSSLLPSSPSPSWRHLWNKLVAGGARRTNKERVELLVDFTAEKMNGAWEKLEKAPAGSAKKKMHGLGLKLLSRVKPSETFLRSVSDDVTNLDITFPSSLNPRLVRRRLRHIARRGSVNHRTFFYASVSLIPFTAALSVLPLPNIPFFWLLFRAFANWRALKGSERLLLLVSDSPAEWRSLVARHPSPPSPQADGGNSLLDREPWTLRPCEELEKLAVGGDSEQALRKICEMYRLNETEVLRCCKEAASP